MSSECKLYQVKEWELNFEGAKSKSYSNKTTCSMPTKHGLGYKRLVRRENGAALFGAWCALIQVLSRHPKPRRGYCTDTGGIPQGYCENSLEGKAKIYTPEDLEFLTDLPASLFSQIFEICQTNEIGWLKVLHFVPRDTMRIPEVYHADTTGSLNSDLDSDSNSDSNSDLDPNAAGAANEEKPREGVILPIAEEQWRDAIAKIEDVKHREGMAQWFLMRMAHGDKFTRYTADQHVGHLLRIPAMERDAAINASLMGRWKNIYAERPKDKNDGAWNPANEKEF